MLQHLRTYLSRDGLGPTLVRALAGSAGIRIVGMGFSFLVGVQLARGLGAESYGVYGLAMAVISMMAIPAEFGLPQLVTREVAAAQVHRDWQSIRRVLRWAYRTVFGLAIAVLVAGAALVALSAHRFSDSVRYTVAAGFLFVIFAPLGNVCGAAMRGMQRIVIGQLPEVVLRPALFSSFLFVSVLVFPGRLDAVMAMSLQVGAVGAATAVAYVLLQRDLPKAAVVDTKAGEARGWLHSAWPMALTEAMRAIHGNLTLLVLGAVAHASIVGIFRVASSTSALLTMPISLVHVVLAPVISRLYAWRIQI